MEIDHGQPGYRFRVGKNTVLVMSHAEYKERQRAGKVVRLKQRAVNVIVAILAVVFLVFVCITLKLLHIYLAG